MKHTYFPKGVCSRMINLEIENDIITAVDFTGGCNGNTQGISNLVVGMDVDTAIKKLSGINCNGRGTSCPDQLAKALSEAKGKN